MFYTYHTICHLSNRFFHLKTACRPSDHRGEDDFCAFFQLNHMLGQNIGVKVRQQNNVPHCLFLRGQQHVQLNFDSVHVKNVGMSVTKIQYMFISHLGHISQSTKKLAATGVLYLVYVSELISFIILGPFFLSST